LHVPPSAETDDEPIREIAMHAWSDIYQRIATKVAAALS
jgi:hypothetical protein